MPIRKYALSRGEPKRVEISWTAFSFKSFIIRFDGYHIGTISSRQELEMGRDFPLADGSVLRVQMTSSFLNTQLRVLRNGQPLPGSPSDPFYILRTAYWIIFFVGGLSTVLGLIVTLLATSGSQAPGLAILLSGLIFLLLGFFVRRQSAIALGIAVGLYALDALISLFTGGFASIPVHIFFLIMMCRGFSAIQEIRNTAASNQVQQYQ
jgi:hypothetical protein